MSFPNCLAADCYEGDINGIGLEWADNAKSRLPEHASQRGLNATPVKALTEHLAHSTAVRLGKNRVRIMGTLHDTTTISGTGETKQDELHITIKVMPGRWNVHIYVEGIGQGEAALDNVKVRGESVVRPGQITRDADLSTGILPQIYTS
ncbi:hypothetical protein FQN54_004920 [Arachnomyces sp. PD_36]|nr:hypothetical protein FQN54_004920 [Arachnomyces sp. PD_36]